MGVIGDLNQQQLAQLLALYQEEHATSLARQEDLNARLDAVMKGLANLKANVEAIENGNQNQGWKGKALVAGSQTETGGNSMIPKHIKLDFPRFCGHEDPLGWLNRCEHYFRYQHTQEEEKIGLASFHLEGIAQQETRVMGDLNQQQLAQLLALFQEERATNLARQEDLNARLDAVMKDLASLKAYVEAIENGNQNQGWKGKVVVAGSGSEMGGNSMIPNHTKLDIPRFYGHEDPLGWMNMCEHYFRFQHTQEEEKIRLASFHLGGIAQLWFLQLEKDMPQCTWDEFKRQCNLHFGPSIRSQKLGELAKLCQIGSVADYQEKFEQLISQAGTLTQAQKIELYISGLADYIAIEVELHNPPDLATAMNISRLYERKEQPLHSQLLDACKSKTTNFSPQQHAKFAKKLTRSEMDERWLKGLCFNCDELFTGDHQCKKLFWIDFIDDEEELLSTLPHLALEDKRDWKLEGGE
ncbi:hypothetical protein KY290_007210 [Solanum tuberosum]|uniref:Ty3 transposon capsid-like protein domain-containing protein n=1 Tax=Solanum tuberosum TaxID=4113 RepID=A0ABQ7W6V4_SOLTU|nr:hypothetical protein KY290_007210 [Solanum tuberosum]